MQKGPIKKMTITSALRKEIIHIIDERINEVHVTKEDFSELKSIVRDIALAQKRTESRLEELAEAQKRTEITMSKGFKDLRDSISALGGRWGIMAEGTFRSAISGLLRDRGYEVTNGVYGGREVDIIIRNGEHILIEVTSSMKKSDIGKIVSSADDYEAKTGISPRIMIAAIYIPPMVMREIVDAKRKVEIFSMDE